MSVELDDQSIRDNELLARFILYSKWIRQSDYTVRADAFIPYPYPNLSVTRHDGLSEIEIWQIGKDVVSSRPNATLYGRADLLVNEVRNQTLQVISDPIINNKNHAHISGWPLSKPEQKSIAQELAAIAQYKLYK